MEVDIPKEEKPNDRRPFIDKKSLFNNPKKFYFKAILGKNRIGRTMFIFVELDTGKELVNDLKREEIYKFEKKYGLDKNLWLNHVFLMYSELYKADGYNKPAYTLRVQLI